MALNPIPSLPSLQPLNDGSGAADPSVFRAHLKGSRRKGRSQQMEGLERQFVCPVCGRRYANPNALNKHSHLHNDKHFACTICGRRVATKFELRRHMRFHTGTKPFQCRYCDYGSSEKSNVTRHELRHTQPNARPIGSGGGGSSGGGGGSGSGSAAPTNGDGEKQDRESGSDSDGGSGKGGGSGSGSGGGGGGGSDSDSDGGGGSGSDGGKELDAAPPPQTNASHKRKRSNAASASAASGGSDTAIAPARGPTKSGRIPKRPKRLESAAALVASGSDFRKSRAKPSRPQPQPPLKPTPKPAPKPALKPALKPATPIESDSDESGSDSGSEAVAPSPAAANTGGAVRSVTPSQFIPSESAILSIPAIDYYLQEIHSRPASRLTPSPPPPTAVAATATAVSAAAANTAPPQSSDVAVTTDATNSLLEAYRLQPNQFDSLWADVLPTAN